jgi:hypothetical protein
MFTPTHYGYLFRTFAEGDAYLEVALLAACGYTADDVLHTLVRLVKERKIPLYRTGPSQGHLLCGNRWNTGFGAPHFT